MTTEQIIMKIINQFLQEKTISYGRAEYSKEKIREYEKKKYLSNGYWWYYLGRTPGGLNSNGLPYVECPAHIFCWNTYHPDNKVTAADFHLIHHKNGNKKDNRIQNLIKVTQKEHNREHLTKRRKEMPSKFSSKTSALGGKHSHQKD